MRIVSLLFAAMFLVGEVQAHDVIWWENPDGSSPTNVSGFYYPIEVFDYISVVPSKDEPCEVLVNLDPVNSTLIRAQALPPNPSNDVVILIRALRPPNGNSETVNVRGEWHATGLPAGLDCSSGTNQFTVPIMIIGSPPVWHVLPAKDGRMISIDTGIDCALQAAESVTGPWLNVGKGQTFTVSSEMPVTFFQRLRRLGGLVSGKVTDPAGNPLSATTVGLLYGGPTASTDTNGAFSLPRLPWGTNLITISNAAGATLNLAVPAATNTVANFRVAMEAAPPATNACHCTPWCAIGFGSVSGELTPVYYAGGANGATNGPSDCDQPIVTVTTPSGTSYPITPGSSRHQNTGPGPASGAWTITATVCGQTNSCTVTVP